MAASTLTISTLLQPERAARRVQQQALDRSLPGFATVTDRLIAASFDGPATSGIDQKIRNAQRVIVVKKLIALAGKGSSPAVRGVALLKLE